MATVNIKQNNIDFTVDNVNTPKSWFPAAGSTFAPADLGTNFNINILKTAEAEGWLNDLRVLHGLFIDWDGAQITLNGTSYTIHNTGELFSAIKDANKTYPLGNYQGKLRCSSFYTKYHVLLRRINKLIDDKKSISYIEPLKSITYKLYDQTGINIGVEGGIDLNGKVTMPSGEHLVGENETFIGWICSLDRKIYKAGETFTLTEELYDLCEDVDVIQFIVVKSPYSVGIDVTNGRYTGTSLQTIEYGGYASWEVNGDDGYLPISVTNGTISGNMVTSDTVTKDFTVYVDCANLSYIESYPAKEYSFYIDNIKVYDNSWIGLGQTITLPAPQDEELGNDKELFEGWRCELNGNLYQPGDQYTLTLEDYEKISEDVFTFSASFKNSYYVGINITNGGSNDGQLIKRIKYGKQASWPVYANEDDGYILPTSVTNGTISGYIVTSDIVTKDFTVYVNCVRGVSEPDISYIEPDVSYIEPGLTDPE